MKVKATSYFYEHLHQVKKSFRQLSDFQKI